MYNIYIFRDESDPFCLYYYTAICMDSSDTGRSINYYWVFYPVNDENDPFCLYYYTAIRMDSSDRPINCERLQLILFVSFFNGTSSS